MYTQELKLKNSEKVIIVDQETGETREIAPKQPANPDVATFKPNSTFVKMYPAAWNLLYTQTTPTEFKVAQKLSTMAKMITNSLEPLDDETTYRELSKEFDVSIGKIKSVFQKLFTLGVYGKFEVYNSKMKHTKYWVFNPYLSCNGKAMSLTTMNLFTDTAFAKIGN